jgi:hypothetical protein
MVAEAPALAWVVGNGRSSYAQRRRRQKLLHQQQGAVKVAAKTTNCNGSCPPRWRARQERQPCYQRRPPAPAESQGADLAAAHLGRGSRLCGCSNIPRVDVLGAGPGVLRGPRNARRVL